MITKKLVWRLSKLPSVEELRQLVKDGIINKEEVRAILFNTETEENRDKKSLESEIKFLRELVDKLASREKIIATIKEIEVPYKTYPWYDSYIVWCSGTSNTFTTTNGYGISSNGTYINGSRFSDIKTF